MLLWIRRIFGYSPSPVNLAKGRIPTAGEMKLVIGNKNYSSWSMRAWVLLRHFEVAFEEIRIPLFIDGYQDELRNYSPTLRVPVLIDGDNTVWDSLAICEYVSEKYLDGRALPENVERRARCRSYCCEMHSGFMSIRNQLPMNCRAKRQLEVSVEAKSEIKRIDALFSDARQLAADNGDYLFGPFSIADCMFAPVAMRFSTYAVELSELSQKYIDTLLNNYAVKQWREQAMQESEILPDFEFGDDLVR